MAKKKKKKCPRCGKKFVRLGSHMKVHENDKVDFSGLTDIRVVGVGGAGGNIVTRMKERNKNDLQGIEYIAVNTDAQDLDNAEVDKKIQIGKALTKGLGAGMNPEVGQKAAEENRSEIKEAIEGADVVFITAGFGGGTGSGGAPVVAETAREEGILTIAIVTKPFSFEGAKKHSIAEEALGRIQDKVDALVVVPNDRIFTVISKDTPVQEAFEHIDEILNHGVRAIAELINMPGIINVDFADIKSILNDAGHSMIGVGTAEGKERSAEAVGSAINSPLLEASIEGARGALFSVAGGKDLKMSEINDIAKSVVSNLDSNAQVIFGAYHDQGLKKKSIKVTVIATGFNGVVNGAAGSNKVPQLFSQASKKSSGKKVPVNKGKDDDEDDDNSDKKKNKNKNQKDSDDSPWDIPAFLRKKDN